MKICLKIIKSLITIMENYENKPKKGWTYRKGLKKPYQAQLRYKKRTIYLGSFDNEEEAHNHYVAALAAKKDLLKKLEQENNPHIKIV